MAAIGAGLGSMVAKLTLGVRKFEKFDSKMREIIPSLHEASHTLITMIDADTNAFNDYVKALGLPKTTPEEKKIRFDKMQEGLKKAIEIPLETMKIADTAWKAMNEVARYGNIASKSDVEVGAKALKTGIWGAYKNVLINVKEIEDETYKNYIVQKAADINSRAAEKCRQVLDILENRE